MSSSVISSHLPTFVSFAHFLLIKIWIPSLGIALIDNSCQRPDF